MTADEQQWIERRGRPKAGTERPEPGPDTDVLVTVVAWHGPLSALSALVGVPDAQLRTKLRSWSGGRLRPSMNLHVQSPSALRAARRRILATGEDD
jgi:hypothetical protein